MKSTRMFSCLSSWPHWVFCLCLLHVPTAIQAQGVVGQWVQSATATSQYSSGCCPASKLVGVCDTGFFCDGDSVVKDSLTLTFTNKICVSAITIYEVYWAGFVIGVSAFSPSNTWQSLWTGGSNRRAIPGGLAFAPLLLTSVNYTTDKFKIDVDDNAGFNSYIDAAQVFGSSVCAGVTTSQWVQSTTATSENSSYPASKVAGGCDGQAWMPSLLTSPLTASMNITIQSSVCIVGIAIYEWQVTGLTTGISAFSPSGKWDVLWSGNSSEYDYFGDLAFSPNLTTVAYMTNKLKLDFNPSFAGSSKIPQVDAVQVFGLSACPLGQVGVLCAVATDCLSNGTCSASKCACATGFIASSDNKKCLATVGTTCSAAADCLNNGVCTAFKCSCNTSFIASADNKKCLGTVGASCSGATDCLNNGICSASKCACTSGYFAAAGNRQCHLYSPLTPIVDNLSPNILTLVDNSTTTCSSNMRAAKFRLSNATLNTMWFVVMTGHDMQCGNESQWDFYSLFLGYEVVVGGPQQNGQMTMDRCNLVMGTQQECHFECPCKRNLCEMLFLFSMGCSNPQGDICEVALE